MKRIRLLLTRPVISGLASLLMAGAVAGVLLDHPAASPAQEALSAGPRLTLFPDPTGAVATFTPAGRIDRRNPFFQSLGTNGRACADCHQPRDAWSLAPAHIREIFDSTRGRDPLFRTVDGSNSPDADVTTLAARRRAYSMLLTKGLIRVHMPIPTGAEFTLEAVDDPYGHASAADLSLFRRPLPAANLPFLSAVMWDGRQTLADPGTGAFSLTGSLASQAADAVQSHAQGTAPPTPAQVRQIIAFETGVYTAQIADDEAGWLNHHGALGGPLMLSRQPFYLGINDVLGGDPTGAPFDPSAMALYTAWENAQGGGDGDRDDERAAARQAVARGEALFNTKQFVIHGVAGLNDALKQDAITVTCTTCHDAPGVGDHSVKLPLDIGLTDASRRTPDLPLYTLRNKATGETVQTTDPGRALITGKWADIGKFKGPILRGLAARAPYFHNGSAATLGDVLDFYDTRFGIGFTPQEKSDLVAFLRSL